METFTLNWTSGSGSQQEWDIIGKDSFSLCPGCTCTATLTGLCTDYTLAIAVGTTHQETYAQLCYTVTTGRWSVHSPDHHEWRLTQRQNRLTLHCLLKDAPQQNAPVYLTE